MSRLRHEGYAVGDRIKAYDFQPAPGRFERYIIGTITEVNPPGRAAPFGHYVVTVEQDTLSNARSVCRVPMEVYPFEYDNRIQPA